MADTLPHGRGTQRAPRNPYRQEQQNQSLADHLTRHQIDVPDSLKHALAADDHRHHRSKRQCPPPSSSVQEATAGHENYTPGSLDGAPFPNTPPYPRSPPHTSRSPSPGSRTGSDHTADPAPEPVTANGVDSTIRDLSLTAQYIEALKSAALEDSNMSPEYIEQLRAAEPELYLDVDDRHFVKALRTFFSTTNASQATYNGIRSAMMDCYPDDPFLSFFQMRRRVERLSGVVPMYHDMCPNTCYGFTGPLSGNNMCPACGTPRYLPASDKPCRRFVTIPLGPVIQAMYSSHVTAEHMHYREKKTKQILEYARTHDGKVPEYTDTICGKDYLDAVVSGRITDSDVMVQLSLDGAQLYRDKESDCWIFIYIFHNLPPDLRYKKAFVIPGGFIPGPNKPKNIDSFLFPALHHISSLQLEGLKIWDAYLQAHTLKSIPFLGFGTADGPAMAGISGMVGHSGKFGCRLYCALPGRRREKDGHYFPVMRKPHNYSVPGCTHSDVSFIDLKKFRKNIPARYATNINRLLASLNPTQYKERRLETGLTKQTIFSGLQSSLGIPNMFPLDIMHLITINDPDLFLGLWRRTLKYYPPDNPSTWDWGVLRDKVWDSHGKTVELAASFIPSSFGRAPRNLAEKINSGYKAWEYQLYLLGIAPTLLRHILPDAYWNNFCKYVSGVRLLQQWSISYNELRQGEQLLCEFVDEFEDLYYRRRPERIHFIRQSIHLLTHMASETVRVGPLACYAQWPMETAIGNLGEEIRQDRDPYANLAERGILRAQLNSVLAMLPDLRPALQKEQSLPRGAKDLGDGYVLLRACEDTAKEVTGAEANAILAYWIENSLPNHNQWPKTVMRWARLRLPNGQTARSCWYESRSKRPLKKTSCIKLKIQERSELADIRYFFRLKFGNDVYSLALASLFSAPDQQLLKKSSGATYICQYQGDTALMVFDVKCIESVVSMFPDYQVTLDGEIIAPENRFSYMEAPFLKVAMLWGQVDEEETEDTGLE